MHFFEKQRVDLIGQIGVSLQKILLFFMILAAFTLFNGGLFTFVLCLIGFIGAVKRNPRLLMAYYSITIACILLAFFLSIGSMIAYNQQDMDSSAEYYYTSSSSSSVSNSSIPYHGYATPKGVVRSLRAFGGGYKPSPHGGPAPTEAPTSSSAAPSSSAASISSSETYSYGSSSWSEDYYYEDDEFSFFNIFAAVLIIFFYFFISYLKVKSLVLAYKMRKLILLGDLTALLPEIITEDQQPQQKEEPEQNNKCALEENEQDIPAPVPQQTYFTQPGFMPYAPVPMQYPGGPSMVPPPMMYGQYPVYYSFAPAPPSPNPSSDKL